MNLHYRYKLKKDYPYVYDICKYIYIKYTHTYDQEFDWDGAYNDFIIYLSHFPEDPTKEYILTGLIPYNYGLGRIESSGRMFPTFIFMKLLIDDLIDISIQDNDTLWLILLDIYSDDLTYSGNNKFFSDLCQREDARLKLIILCKDVNPTEPQQIRFLNNLKRKLSLI